MRESISLKRVVVVFCFAILVAPGFVVAAPERVAGESIPVIPAGWAFFQTNLVSDVPGIAFVTDPLVANPWGITRTAASAFWIANNSTSTSSVYRQVGSGPFAANPGLASVSIPGGLPTGAVANTTSAFVITSGSASGAALFLFSSLTGNIIGWNPNVPAAGSTSGVIAASNPGHVYTGLAIGSNSSGNLLYAADFANGTIDVFNSTFVLQSSSSFPFADPTIPNTTGNVYHPFNIQNLGGSLYVTYAKVATNGEAENGDGLGFVRRFNTDGVRDLTFGINNGLLNAPWGLALAPASFGILGGALLVGNFSDAGAITGFNPSTGAFLIPMSDEGGVPVAIDQLWGLAFGNGGNGGDVNTLYFTAGVGHEEHGLIGTLRPTLTTGKTLIQFSNSDYLVNETDGTISITVIRSGDTTGSSSVNYAPFDESQPGRARRGFDYIVSPGTLNFGPGETSKTFTVTILSDSFDEDDEAFNLILSNATGAGLTGTKATVLIVDKAPAVPGDLQGDGKVDLVWRNSATGDNAGWLMDGPAVAASGSFPLVADTNFKIVGLGDFQSDGKSDILWRNQSTGANVLWTMDGLTVAASAVLPTVPAPWIVAGVGDFQGDGKTDIMWRNPTTGNNSVWFMNGATVALSAPLPAVGDPNFRVVAIGDFQNDGKSDIFWRNSSTGANVIWLMNGSGIAASAVLPSVTDPNLSIAGCGDFQGDGRDDVIWRNSSTGANFIWFLNGLATPVMAALPPVADTNWQIARVADFQGDGKADIIWRNVATGDDAQWLMDGPSIALASALPSVDPAFKIVTMP